MSSFELVLSVICAFTEMVDNEWIVFLLSTQVLWQVPTTFRKRIPPVVYVSRPLSDQHLSVDVSTVVLELQHVTTLSFEYLHPVDA